MSPARNAPVREESVSGAVVEAVAEAEGTDPLELTPPLYDAVDSDALDRLFADASTDGRMEVAFAYRGYDVSVRGDGSVSVEKRDE